MIGITEHGAPNLQMLAYPQYPCMEKGSFEMCAMPLSTEMCSSLHVMLPRLLS